MKTRSAIPPQAVLTETPPGYTILPFGNGHWRPVLVIASGDGLWARQTYYRELSTDGRTGAVCASQAEALYAQRWHANRIDHQAQRLEHEVTRLEQVVESMAIWLNSEKETGE